MEYIQGLAVYRLHQYTTQAVHLHWMVLNDSQALTAHLQVVCQNQLMAVFLLTCAWGLSLLLPPTAATGAGRKPMSIQGELQLCLPSTSPREELFSRSSCCLSWDTRAPTEDNSQSGFPKLSVDVTHEQLEPMIQEISVMRNQRFHWGLPQFKG